MMKQSRTNIPNLLIISFLAAIFGLASSSNLWAASGGGDEEKEGGGTDFIMHHIKDDYQWHIITLGHTHVTIPLPVIVYDYEDGLKVFMSSDFYDEHHQPKPHGGYYIDHGKLYKLTEGYSASSAHDNEGHEEDHHEEAGSHNEDAGHGEEGAHEQEEAHGNEHEGMTQSGFLDISITKNVASLIISMILLFGVFFTVAKRYKKGIAAPKGIQSLFEPVIVFIRDDIAKVNIGEHKYERFMPYLLTLFFFILFNNLLGLTPGAANLTGNIAVTMCLALFTFFITQFNGRKAYWMHILWTPGVPLPIRPVILVVEVIGIFTKPISLTLRLFASITAGHIVVLSIVGLGFILNSLVVGFVGTLFSVIITLIEILVAVIQAYVFTLFSSMYIGQAVDDGHH
ncbi:MULTISPECIES: F0F1 ATP synthase subunit A [Roseivirga]|jgi:F-type H+-transporting ATPase subunit a|uniref:F0F1 ATP synthase subunit A n=1 Tax=Roseivirga TaxID=290180 RepID=UPI00257B00E3|nr:MULTISPECIES: F0F1 ATP synthase subunit A [Roseivirga]MEC7752840.1 F0F1 ATP synthase subunit A [Bacteroidota bacterium]|tara:strand:+ start:4216 stop:5409 length:1194 start_codon:yes stop_codon:yes gene_type:complete